MKRRTFLYHLAFWVAIYLLWVVSFRSYSVSLSKTLTIEFCYLIFITADFYIVNNFIIPQILQQKRYTFFVVCTVFTIGFSAWLRTLLAIQIQMLFFHATAPDFQTILTNSSLNISLWVLLITIGKMLIDRMETEKQLELLEKQKIKNELDYLKAQINPHALFNSLNTIYGHIDKNNQVARNILLQFSELLRYQLYDCGEEKVNIEKEMAYIKNYVAFQRLRKDEKLIVDIEIGAVETGLKIAPLLLIVLIENAFKFISSHSEKENKITIRLHTQNSILYSVMTNTKESLLDTNTGSANGIGLVNLKRRLELLYPHKYELAVKNEETYYEASLTIDLA